MICGEKLNKHVVEKLKNSNFNPTKKQVLWIVSRAPVSLY